MKGRSKNCQEKVQSPLWKWKDELINWTAILPSGMREIGFGCVEFPGKYVDPFIRY